MIFVIFSANNNFSWIKITFPNFLGHRRIFFPWLFTDLREPLLDYNLWGAQMKRSKYKQNWVLKFSWLITFPDIEKNFLLDHLLTCGNLGLTTIFEEYKWNGQNTNKKWKCSHWPVRYLAGTILKPEKTFQKLSSVTTTYRPAFSSLIPTRKKTNDVTKENKNHKIQTITISTISLKNRAP